MSGWEIGWIILSSSCGLFCVVTAIMPFLIMMVFGKDAKLPYAKPRPPSRGTRLDHAQSNKEEAT